MTSDTSYDISKGATSIGRASNLTSFVNKVIQLSVTFWRSSWDRARHWPVAAEHQLWTIVHASLALPILSSVLASAPTLTCCHFQSLVKASFKCQLRYWHSVWLHPEELRSVFFWSKFSKFHLRSTYSVGHNTFCSWLATRHLDAWEHAVHPQWRAHFRDPVGDSSSTIEVLLISLTFLEVR